MLNANLKLELVFGTAQVAIAVPYASLPNREAINSANPSALVSTLYILDDIPQFESVDEAITMWDGSVIGASEFRRGIQVRSQPLAYNTANPNYQPLNMYDEIIERSHAHREYTWANIRTVFRGLTNTIYYPVFLKDISLDQTAGGLYYLKFLLNHKYINK